MSQTISQTSTVPGLMRTRPHLNANFKGKHRAEYTRFSLGATRSGYKTAPLERG